MSGLKNKFAIVAGAAPGIIGGATSIRLAEEGMAVVLLDPPFQIARLGLRQAV